MSSQANAAWWKFNSRLVVVCLFAWLCLTATVSSLEFVTSAQLIPLSYLILVVAYCGIMNRRAAIASVDSEEKLSQQAVDPAGISK
jgi:uncharacterized membrane protein